MCFMSSLCNIDCGKKDPPLTSISPLASVSASVLHTMKNIMKHLMKYKVKWCLLVVTYITFKAYNCTNS